MLIEIWKIREFVRNIKIWKIAYFYILLLVYPVTYRYTVNWYWLQFYEADQVSYHLNTVTIHYITGGDGRCEEADLHCPRTIW